MLSDTERKVLKLILEGKSVDDITNILKYKNRGGIITIIKRCGVKRKGCEFIENDISKCKKDIKDTEEDIKMVSEDISLLKNVLNENGNIKKRCD